MTGKSMRYRCNCGGKLYVSETRATDEAIYRTRKCRDCTWLFTTKEEAIEGGIPRAAIQPRVKKSRSCPELVPAVESGRGPEPRDQNRSAPGLAGSGVAA